MKIEPDTVEIYQRNISSAKLKRQLNEKRKSVFKLKPDLYFSETFLGEDKIYFFFFGIFFTKNVTNSTCYNLKIR